MLALRQSQKQLNLIGCLQAQKEVLRVRTRKLLEVALPLRWRQGCPLFQEGRGGKGVHGVFFLKQREAMHTSQLGKIRGAAAETSAVHVFNAYEKAVSGMDCMQSIPRQGRGPCTSNTAKGGCQPSCQSVSVERGMGSAPSAR